MYLYFITKSGYIDGGAPMMNVNHYLIGKDVDVLSHEQLRILINEFDNDFIDRGEPTYDEVIVGWNMTNIRIDSAQDVTENFLPAIKAIQNAVPF